MVSILPVRDLDTLAELNRKYEAAAAFACCLYEGGHAVGTVLYDVDFTGREGVIRRLDASADDAADGLCRAVFSILSDAGIDVVRFDTTVDLAPIRRLGFVRSDDRRTGSLRTILQGCTHCIRTQSK